MANIAFGTFKGGAGKSTACACIGMMYAERGDSVTILDLDENATLSRWFNKVKAAGLVDKYFPSLTVIGVKRDDFSAVYRSEAVKASNHVLMDLAGARDDTYNSAVGRSTLVIVPVQQSEPDIHEAERVLTLIGDVEEVASRPIPHRLLFNRVRPLATRLDAHIAQHVKGRGHHAFQTHIIDRVAYREIFTTGTPPQVREPAKVGPELAALMAEIDAVHGQDIAAQEKRA